MGVLVECCLNGARRPGEHERLPVTAGQLAGAARAAVSAGARALHMHPRDGDGFETLVSTWCDAAVGAVRSACPGVPVGVTTGAWIEPDLERRLAAIRSWHVLPDFCSLNLSEAGWERVAAALIERRIGIEAGLGSAQDAERAFSGGIEWTRVLIEPGDEEPDAALARASAIDDILDAGKALWPRLHHGSEMATWHVIRQGLERGWDVRVGLEDVLQMPDGRLARDNAELVAAVIAMAEGAT
jgi:uncharacterized protein (DUF849 family)